MSHSSANVTMEVPASMVEQLQQYMNALSMTQNATTQPTTRSEEFPRDDYEDTEELEQAEVSKIHRHRIKEDGTWQFELSWKKSRAREWVNDQDCSCEYLISEYLNKQGISTAYLFCRVSTQEQAQSTNISLEAQEAELRAAVSTMPFQRVRVYSISQSAYRRIPTTLRRIGEAALKGDAILVWRVDRLSRNIEEYMEWIKELHEREVMLYSHQESITYAENKIAFLQALLDSQKEAFILGERVKLANKRKRDRGDEQVGGLPYGKRYKRILNPDGTTHHKEVESHPEECAIINLVIDMRKTMGACDIARQLNRDNVQKRGRKWSKGMVERMPWRIQ